MKFNWWRFVTRLGPALRVAWVNSSKASPGGRGWTKAEALDFKATLLGLVDAVVDDEFQKEGIDLSDLSELGDLFRKEGQ